jgi:hypothetical protein
MQTIELKDTLGEPVAIATQRTPRQCQRDGFTGLIQHPEAYDIDLLSTVYGIPFPIVPYEYDPPASVDPIPDESDEVCDYLLAFHESARRIAMHPRIVDRLQRRSPWFDPEDMPQEALERILSNPERYALVDPHQGARQAVRDILDDLRNGHRTLIDGARIDRKQVMLRESMPDDRPDYVDPDDEAERLISSGIVSARSAYIALAMSTSATRPIVAESLGISERALYRYPSRIAAEVLVNSSLAVLFPS